MTQAASKFEELERHAAVRPRITSEMLRALQQMAEKHPSEDMRGLGTLLLKYFTALEEWQREQDKLVRALPQHGDPALVELLVQAILGGPAIQQVQEIFAQEEAWRRDILARAIKLRGSHAPSHG